MLDLDLLTLRDRIRVDHKPTGPHVWDPIRKKWLIQTKEELVRQLLIVFLRDVLSYPATLIQVEKGIQVHGLQKRFDILVYTKSIQPYLLIECV